MTPIKKPTIPYAGTTIDPEDTKADIKKLLKSHGITKIQDTTVDGDDVIRFVGTVNGRDLTFEVRPPPIYETKRTWNAEKGRYEKLSVYMVAQAWRLVYWYLEAKLKAVKWGLVSIEREFLNQLLVGPNTLGDVISERISRDQDILKLEAPPEEGRRAVDAGVDRP